MFLFKRNVQGWLLPVGIYGQEVTIAYDLQLKDLVNDSRRSNLNRFRFRNAFLGLNGTTVEGFVWIYVDLAVDSSHLKMKVTKLQKKRTRKSHEEPTSQSLTLKSLNFEKTQKITFADH